MKTEINSDNIKEDIEIIEEVLKGDVEKFETLVLKYQTMIFRFVLKHIYDIDAAEELTQEVFLASFKCLNAYKKNSKFSSWLFGISVNIIRNYINRDLKKKRKCVSIDSLVKSPYAENKILENIADKYECKKCIKAIKNLPEDLREVCVLVALEEKSYIETGEILKLPVGTIKSRMFRARQKLKDTLS
ncbi:MAG TPA: sigma-70 family RNA polymerase sigma factor [bacterium]|nr:sigma-70 family RNA polymerase sigma factor [bacterium]HPN30367.1 sigma-70 family RNA polymerase sigma factor [bacterium]